ncbi:MAG: universal stress protein [Candidatus Eremiobacteraeota bacterium]|nr:universal stress protein [Candidatus Eremiobacteraeota bacterium]MBV8356076.1 universal stress protein [Candidatus Eremiobacteraeota bacterium]
MFKEILVAIDGSPPSDGALDLAIELARSLSASLTILHVIDPAHVSTTIDAAAATAIDIELEELEEAGRGLLEEATARAKAAGLAETTTMLRDGMPAPTILDTAKRADIALIVLGTHARSGVARLFLGSTAEAVLRQSPVPVLVRRG